MSILCLAPCWLKAAGLPESNKRILRSSSELDYPPFAPVRSDRSADGFSVDLLKAAAKAAVFEVFLPVRPWHEIKQKLIEGENQCFAFELQVR